VHDWPILGRWIYLGWIIAWRDMIPRFIGFGMANDGVFEALFGFIYDVIGIYARVSILNDNFYFLFGLLSRLGRRFSC
jgi:hypothetical protein